jgi:hypothetical protein
MFLRNVDELHYVTCQKTGLLKETLFADGFPFETGVKQIADIHFLAPCATSHQEIIAITTSLTETVINYTK